MGMGSEARKSLAHQRDASRQREVTAAVVHDLLALRRKHAELVEAVCRHLDRCGHDDQNLRQMAEK